MNTQTELLNVYLRELRLSTFRQNHESFAADAAHHNYDYARYLLALAEAEVQQREANRRKRRLKEAKIPIHKTLSTFDFSAIPSLKEHRIHQLTQGAYLDKAESIILVGNPGLGKSHIATALAISACQQMHRVRFYNAAALVNELILAHQEQRLSRFLDAALRYKLLVVDELGFIPFSDLGAQLMFQFFSTLYERVALIVTTNLAFTDWTSVFGSEKLTLALLDRLTHKAHIIEFVGDSFRFRQRLGQQEASLASSNP